MIYPVRRWALTSLVEWAGKTTFLAANAPTPAFIIDADARYGLVEHLIKGPAFFATPQAVMDPLRLMEETTAIMQAHQIASITADPVTKIYSIHSRRASMAGRLTSKQREDRGYGKNVAALHISKADAIEVLANLSAYGLHTFYSWHLREGVNSSGDKGVRDRISAVELNTLRQSIDVELEFTRRISGPWQTDKDAQQYEYGVTVVSARGIAGQSANVGFTIWDPLENFWAGAADRLERLIYTSFTSPTKAIAWAEDRFEGDPPIEPGKEYAECKRRWAPDNAGQMYSAWIEHIDSLVAGKVAPGKQIVAEEPVNVSDLKYAGGSSVALEDVDDFIIYQRKFDKAPYDQRILGQAKEINLKTSDWE